MPAGNVIKLNPAARRGRKSDRAHSRANRDGKTAHAIRYTALRKNIRDGSTRRPGPRETTKEENT